MPVKYDDKFVKRPKAEIEYTPEMIRELQLCREDVNYFLKYVKIVNPDLGEIFFEPHDYQFELLGKFQEHRFNIAMCTRQSGKTTIVSAYALWYAMFHGVKNIGIVSNKEKAAISFLTRLKYQYELLNTLLWRKVFGHAVTNGTKAH